ncbi:MAG: hypothetical protein PHH60_03995 [Candidatus Margulisbacteria bacterium]|nr:hypothetical protein [Candidatus Margulisiibacteriota bacterium]
MKKTSGIFLLLLFTAGMTFAETIKVKSIQEGSYTVKASDKSSGKARWENIITIKKTGAYIYVEGLGRGLYGKDNKNLTWKSEAYATWVNDELIPYNTKIVFKNSQGEVVQTLNKSFNRASGKVICDVDGKTKQFTFYDDLLDREIMGIVLSSFPYKEKPEMIFHILTHEPQVYKVAMKYRGLETVTLNGRAVECYKLEMVLDLGAMNIFGAFVPKTYFWYQTAAPHDFVRYEGLESGLGTPYIVMEGE